MANRRFCKGKCCKCVILLCCVIAAVCAWWIQWRLPFWFASRADKMYAFAGVLARERIQQRSPEAAQVLNDLSKQDIVVIQGTYDHIENMFKLVKVPHTLITHHDLNFTELHPRQTVFLNCAANFDPKLVHKLEEFVRLGGRLITTDWALMNVLEVGFPGMVRHNGNKTQDDVVPIQLLDPTDAAVKGFLDGVSQAEGEDKAEPVWWLENASFPIEILDEVNVRVLVKSDQLKEKYGEEAVIVKFNHGKGDVYHMISHFYLQRSESRSLRHRLRASDYALSSRSLTSVTYIRSFEAYELPWEQITFGELQGASCGAQFALEAAIEHQLNFQRLSAAQAPRALDSQPVPSQPLGQRTPL